MSKKEENAKRAAEWIEQISASNSYMQSIENAKSHVKIFREKLFTKDDEDYIVSISKKAVHNTECIIKQATTHEVLNELYLNNAEPSVCVLDFASFYNPGGGFMKGSYAQEESLCAVSGLYPILSSLDIYGERKKREHVPPTYSDELIYVPMVPFSEADGYPTASYMCDVAVIAAPNCNRVPVTKADTVPTAIRYRLESVFVHAYLEGCHTLVLGAWGCGVFKNDPTVIANTFKMLQKKYDHVFEKIVYAVPNEKLYNIFNKVLFAEG